MPPVDAGQYIIEARIYAGEFAEILRARDSDGKRVALKRILRDRRTRTALRSLEHEARVGLTFDHPNIIEVYHFIPGPPEPVMVMEFFPSRNLKVRAHAPRGDRLLVERMPNILEQMAFALLHVHDKGYIHMDLKPENFLLNDEGHVKLTDFAITTTSGGALRAIKRLLPGRRRIAGTRPYIAPETLLRRDPDYRTDIYSFGATVFEVLTGRPPFIADDRDELLAMHLRDAPPWPWTYNKNLTREINDLVLAMLAKSPERRPQSMADVYARIKRVAIYKEPPQEARRSGGRKR
ncbi:MAG: serine/threonine protein kinase [Candidatus Brocadiia bacterium]